MQDVAMRRRLAALVIAVLLAISGAALATAYFAADDQAAANTGNSIGVDDIAIRGGHDQDKQYGGRD